MFKEIKDKLVIISIDHRKLKEKKSTNLKKNQLELAKKPTLRLETQEIS